MGVLKQPRGLSLISTAGLEPAKLSQLILNQPCLPISPRRCYLSNEPLTSLRRTRSMVFFDLQWPKSKTLAGGLVRNHGFQIVNTQMIKGDWRVSNSRHPQSQCSALPLSYNRHLILSHFNPRYRCVCSPKIFPLYYIFQNQKHISYKQIIIVGA